MGYILAFFKGLNVSFSTLITKAKKDVKVVLKRK